MYTSFYNLKEEPFRLTPDPKFLHLAETHKQALVSLLKGIVRRQGFLVLTGDAGTGKTTLLHAMFTIFSRKLTGDQRLATAFIVNPTLSRDEFLEYLLQELEINCLQATKPRRLQALHEFLLATYRRGATTVIVIDEAQLAPTDILEEIRLLGNVDTYGEKLLQVVLCGQPELDEMLARPGLRALNQRMAVKAQLRQLSGSETRAYIAERLFVAGLQQGSPFPTESVGLIHKLSGGLPRLVNLLCDSSLSLGFESNRKMITPIMVFEAASSLGLDPGRQLDRHAGRPEIGKTPSSAQPNTNQLSPLAASRATGSQRSGDR